MKRVCEDSEEGKDNSGLKRLRILDVVHENSGNSERTEGQEEKGDGDEVVGTRMKDKYGLLPVNEASSGLGLNDSDDEMNKRDFDINFSFVSNDFEKVEQKLEFDLNAPSIEVEDYKRKQEFQEYAQAGPAFNGKKAEIIDILSDESDHEMEIEEYKRTDDKGKGKLIDVGMPDDSTESLTLGLGLTQRYDLPGQSSLSNGGEKLHMPEDLGENVDLWLSLNANCERNLELLAEALDFVEMNQPVEDAVPVEPDYLNLDGAGRWVPREERRAEEARQTAKRAARYLARANHENESSLQEQRPARTEAKEQLGNSSGPFSDALQIIKARTDRGGSWQLIKWSSSKNHGHTTPVSTAPSLLDLSLKALAENAEAIVSLDFVPDILRKKLTDWLCDHRQMNAHVLDLLVKGCPTEIRIKDSSWLTEQQFVQSFRTCATSSLRVLQLDLCGQCMSDYALRDILARPSISLQNLAIVSLRGACRLSDSGIEALVTSSPALRSLNLGQCTLLTSDAIGLIADSLGSILRELYIDDCQKIDATLILPSLRKFAHLEVLSVAGIQSVCDQFVSSIATICGENMKELDLSNCLKLTDNSLRAIGNCCADLRALNLSNLHNLSDVGLEYLANGCRSIQKLNLSRNGFSDEAVAAFVETAGESLKELSLNNVTKVGSSTAFSLAKCSRKLLSLDASWCRKITDEALGLIVDCCSSLKLLKVFGCTQITHVFLNGHSNPFLQIIGLNLTPILKNLNMLEPEEVLLCYSQLPISSET